MTKRIVLSDEVYDLLFRLKNKNESFSDVILRLSKNAPKKFNIDHFAGKWKDYDEWNDIQKELALGRKRFKTTKVNFDW